MEDKKPFKWIDKEEWDFNKNFMKGKYICGCDPVEENGSVSKSALVMRIDNMYPIPKRKTMNKDEKYYTPTIEEFRTGFEYELMIPEKETWSKEIFYLNESHIELIKYVSIQNEFTKNKIRVKYLNKEDIESLGFKTTYLGHSDICKDETFQCIINNKDYQFTLYDDNRFVIEHQNWDTEELEMLFNGTIKNKSELKILLKQLNIF